ncbi:MAG: TetR/AcrR family transcriptional regulator [Chloroflexota bacterium]|nr:TetR/AcrR family transcriptional regulator [Chloroflexota bacterium]
MPKVTVEHLEARKNQILEAARACFLRKGFHQTTMQDICQECGLSPGAIYRYFRSKEDVVETASEQGRGQQMDLIRQVRERLGTPEVLDALAQHFFGMLASVEDWTPAELQIWAESLRNARLREIMRRGYQEYLDVLAGIIGQGMAEGKFNPNLDPKAVTQVAIAIFEGTAMQKAVFPDEVDIQKVLQVVHSLFAGEFWCGSSSNQARAGVADSKAEG